MTNLNTLISYLSDLIEAVLSETFNSYNIEDLTQQQLHYLQVISRLHNPTITELSRELQLTKPTVTVLVDKLVSKGYVRRVPSDSDRRVTHLHLDEKGKIIEQLRMLAYKGMEERISSELNETEITILTEILKKLASKF
ncbi:MAG: MarR family transcriptional regulator [Bacteroidales bacterium]|nr:MarR family transcriptional regulator [Bacteroidales bacterium]